MRIRIASLILLLLALTLGGCFRLGGAPVGEVAELATMGGERPLRDTYRPVRGETRVLVFALDGVAGELLFDAVRAGRMPHLSRLLGAERGEGEFERAYAVPDMLTILPSATIPAWGSVFTGAPPAQTGIAGNEWFVRDEVRFYAPAPITVTSRSHALKIYTDELLSELLRAPTVYEQLPQLRSHVSLNPYFRGADLLTVPNLGEFGDLVGAVVGETLTGSARKSARVAREIDQTSVASLLESIRERGVPDLQTVYFNGIDLMTHYAEAPLEDQRRYLEAVTDTLIDRVLDAYRESGALDRTYVLLLSDHGHTPVLPDDRHSLGVEGEDEPPALLREVGFRVRPFSLSTEDATFQATLAYQGFMAYLYLADRSTCPQPGDRCDWSRPPRLEEDVLPVVRAFHRASATGAGVPALRGTLDLIFARAPATYGAAAEVRVFDGERLVPIGEYLRRHPRPRLLRLEERMRKLMLGPYGSRAGDVILLAKAGMERPIEERFYFNEPETSEHGSPHPSDSLVPLIVVHPARSGAAVRATVREIVGASPTVLQIAPLIRALLEGG